MNNSFKLSGFKELDNTLRLLPKATGKRTLRKIGIDGLEPIADNMRRKARTRYGDLEESITVGTKLSRSQKRYAGLMGGRKSQSMVVVHAGPGPNPQSITEEFGTFNQSPNPFVAPAWEAGRRNLFNFVKSNLSTRIKAAADRARKKGTI